MDIVVVGYDDKVSLMIKPESVISISSDMELPSRKQLFLLLVEKNDIYLSKLMGARKFYDNEVPEYPVIIDLVEEREDLNLIMVHGYQEATTLV